MLVTTSYLVCGGDVLTPAGWQEFDLNIVDGIISDAAGGRGEIVDASGLRIVPGFIDLQINGGWGHDLQRDPAAIWALGERLVEIGVTSYLPTLTTNGASRRREALASWQAGPPGPDDYCGAEPIGWHLEGPWLAPSKHGAHSRELLQGVPSTVPADFTPAHGVRLVTLAPELKGALEMIDALAYQGVVVSCGHSEADWDQTIDALDAGATMGTHLFNAMPTLHHRSVTMTAALLSEAPFVGLIVDGVHVAPEMISLAWQLASRRLVLVSDAVATLGTALGAATGDAARLFDGTIAGATVGLDAAIRNLMLFTGCDLADAALAASERPARCLGLNDRGRVEIGRRADLVALDDDGDVVLTFVGGRLAWDAR